MFGQYYGRTSGSIGESYLRHCSLFKCTKIQKLEYDDSSISIFVSMLHFTHLLHLLLGRLQDSNAVLSHFNEYSENCFGEVSPDFSRNTRLLKSMKSDLDYIFQKLRNMKAKILAAYPDAFPDEGTQEALDRRPDLEMG
ncbi:hypothetical protein K2173_015682 [Erythroxylum novogranatense]|uniref:KxDL domain-containing protein n=1 Tax=Erythroxylum novogranatense TaxID=1862640 RepID=A0AAV8SET5_9ROSI|nr:hypothetical protein K2173_015682 [Erythroxylum novogranatense]